MELFVVAGSTGGATRTSSSILLATGARVLGFEPLLIQVSVEGNHSIPIDPRGVPCAKAMVKAKRGERITDRIRARARNHPGCSPVIVDMPAQDVIETLLMLGGVQPQILVPMPQWVSEPGQAVADVRRLWDYWERWEETKRQSGARPLLGARPPSARLLPIGWPVGIVPDDLMRHLRSLSLSDDETRHAVIYPGLPKFEPSEMNSTDASACWALTERQVGASARIAGLLFDDNN